ncbi:unnamed protein product (macronuclear) [Paramecium tetraurelia]|uniref:Uncharacterized protein n=1 Tax=Paramecium tetraurelia TaxID=5888 RepID=A0D7T6_PARTE|nr:uncharacterized protein GSPATT00014070001 [Paramecium tetraurelia]CAK79103.1 unnamed protein product [Paramecium tetraurelia]|eukprot:XP_001446500.1 hypothetical protein (macronuclear) [Paramecium tetraurelia strain d4-2]
MLIHHNDRNMFPAKNEEFVRLRMKNAIATTVLEEQFAKKNAEFALAPHDFHYNRQRCMAGYVHPDDQRTMHMASFNRKHKYKEHYLMRIGESRRMTTVLLNNHASSQICTNYYFYYNSLK